MTRTMVGCTKRIDLEWRRLMRKSDGWSDGRSARSCEDQDRTCFMIIYSIPWLCVRKKSACFFASTYETKLIYTYNRRASKYSFIDRWIKDAHITYNYISINRSIEDTLLVYLPLEKGYTYNLQIRTYPNPCVPKYCQLEYLVESSF